MTETEIKKAREFCKRIRELEKRVARLKLSRDNIVPVIDGMPHATTAKSRVECLALQIVEGERELAILRSELEQARVHVTEAIMLEVDDPNGQALLLLRYVECLPFRDVARRMKYSLRHMFRLHGELLKRCHIGETPCHPCALVKL